MSGFSRDVAFVLLVAVAAGASAAAHAADLTAAAASSESEVRVQAPAGAALEASSARPQAAPTASLSELLSLVPAEAFLVAATRSVTEATGGARACLDSIQPGISAGIPELANPFKAFEGPSDEGSLDAEAPVAFALVATGPEQLSSIACIPAADYQKWRAGWGESLKKSEGGEYEYVEGWYGQRQYFTEKGRYLVFADKAEELDVWAKALDKPLGEGRRRALEKALASAPVALNISVAGLRAAVPDIAEKAEARTKEVFDAVAQGKAGMEVVAKSYGMVARDVISSVDEVNFSADPGGEGIILSADVKAAKGSAFYDMFSQQKETDLSAAAMMPADSFVIFSGGINGDAAWKYITDRYCEMLASAAATPEEAARGREAASAAMAKMRATGMAASMTFSMMPGAGTLAMACIYSANDAEKAVATATELMADKATNPLAWKFSEAAGVKMSGAQVSDEKIDSTSVKVIKMAVDFYGAEPEEQRAFEALMGKEMVMRFAAAEGKVLFTMGQNQETMRGLLPSGDVKRLDITKLEKTNSALGGKAADVVMVSLPDYIAYVLKLAQSVDPNVPRMEFTIPATSGYAGGALSFAEGSARITVVVPIEQIKGAADVMKQMMQQSMMMRTERRPTAVESPGEKPKEQPNAPIDE